MPARSTIRSGRADTPSLRERPARAGRRIFARLLRSSRAPVLRLAQVDAGCVARLRETRDVIDLDYPLLFVDRVEDAVPAGPQAPQVR
jgi:hypothetical protein